MVTIKFSNRALYTFIAVIISIAIIGIVYAVAAPNPGHLASDIDFSEANIEADILQARMMVTNKMTTKELCIGANCATSFISLYNVPAGCVPFGVQGTVSFDGGECTTVPYDLGSTTTPRKYYSCLGEKNNALNSALCLKAFIGYLATP